MNHYIVYLLTDTQAVDSTFSTRTYAYDLQTGDFDEEYLCGFGLNRENSHR